MLNLIVQMTATLCGSRIYSLHLDCASEAKVIETYRTKIIFEGSGP